MKKELGLWLDQREAVLVTVTHTGEEIKRISSDVEQQGHFSAHAPAGSPEEQRDRRLGNHLQQYYADVIVAIREADSILILGPGAAKGEIEKQLEHENLSGRIVGIETVNQLPEPELVARIRHYFFK